GEQEVEFEALGLPSGVYFYRLTAEAVPEDEEDEVISERFTSVRKMILLR
ncbi:MAG: hypothetical protein HY707_03700, partial [Ignavibacteriae bacterium]|nr:hypothetical protein [Ignavibacteriota bacterium]